jgi:DNA-binding beta-propeller fold protein YncE
MLRKREIRIGVACGMLAAVLGIAAACMDGASNGGSMTIGEGDVPLFEVDPLFPKPLPNHWVLGSTIGVDVDSRDHIWIIHRQATVAGGELGATGDTPSAECCIPAPPVLEFDADGNVVQSWGGPGEGYDWPASNHGITVDHMDNIWIGGNDVFDSHILKFTRDGQFLMQIGRPRQRSGSNSTDNFWRVAEISIDPEANEAYVADGYGNKRVAVLDVTTGVMKRFWGAYGNVPDDSPLPPYNPNDPPAQQFRNPVHCAQPSTADGLIYVCDRVGDRILDRETLEVLTEFGDGGRIPGEFFGVHSIAVDSRGNIYTTETYEGKRLQKFVFKGYGTAPAVQGVIWPSRGDDD